MKIFADLCIALVALLHFAFMVLEMFLWQTKFGRNTFGMTREQSAQTAVLAKNQGLYNGFLAAGLVWSLCIANPEFQRSVQTFFLSCIFLAGAYGAVTAKRSILYVQALPALLALGAIWGNAL